MRKQAADHEQGVVDRTLLVENAEQELHRQINLKRESLAPLLAERQYLDALDSLAELRVVIDSFFDEVLVMDKDVAVRANRLSLLHELRAPVCSRPIDRAAWRGPWRSRSPRPLRS